MKIKFKKKITYIFNYTWKELAVKFSKLWAIMCVKQLGLSTGKFWISNFVGKWYNCYGIGFFSVFIMQNIDLIFMPDTCIIETATFIWDEIKIYTCICFFSWIKTTF